MALPLIGLAWIWLSFTAWARPLALPDEGRYVGVAWEMVRSGDWLVPTLDGLPYFQKPPLFYWITAVGLRLFGNHEFAARLAPLLGATAAFVSMHWFATRWWSARGATRTMVTLLTMPFLFAAAQFANMDMLVAGCITVSILTLAHACMLETGRDSTLVRFTGFGFAALGVLAKGLIGLALPAMVVVLWTLATRRPRRLRALAWLPGWLLFVLIAAPWFVLMQARFADFAHYFFVVQHIDRFTQKSFNNAQPLWFYPAVLGALCLPWTVWLLAGKGHHRDKPDANAQVLMWVWLLSILLFFSIPRSKLLGYILPVIPPLAFLLAQRWDWPIGSGRTRALLARVTAVVAGVSCVAVIGAAAHLALKSTKPLAPVLARHGNEPVVFVQAYYFDLPFYAALTDPVTVIDEWESYRQMPADNWHREIQEAAAFAPAATGQKLLGSPALLKGPNCPGKTSWVVGDSRLASKYPMLAGLVATAEHEGISVWKVPDWIPDASDELCAHTR